MVYKDGFDEADWTLLSVGYAGAWQAGSTYSKGVVVTYAHRLLRCKTEHTAAKMENERENWETIADRIANLPTWVAGVEYAPQEVVTYEEGIWRCTALHTSRKSFDATEQTKWELLARLKVFLPDWTQETAYKVGETVVYEGNLYRCREVHHAENRFKSVYWEALNQSADQMRQYEAPGVTAPMHVDLPIHFDAKLCRSGPEVLKYNAQGGMQNQEVDAETFVGEEKFSAGGQSASVSPYFTIDGRAQLNHIYRVQTDETRQIERQTVCKTEWIDFSAWKKIEEIRGGFF